MNCRVRISSWATSRGLPSTDAAAAVKETAGFNSFFESIQGLIGRVTGASAQHSDRPVDDPASFGAGPQVFDDSAGLVEDLRILHGQSR